ncbi:MAG: hypothetical protein AB1792_03385 [Candidatus Zixiibacteriota bacterium]
MAPSREAPRIFVWIADQDEMYAAADFESFLVDRLGASGERTVIEPEAAHAILRTLGLSRHRIFDPFAAQRLATSADADLILWVKMVSRNLASARGLSVPYVLNRRRVDAHVFLDVRLYDAGQRHLIGSKRLRLSDRGEGTWQVADDDRLDPFYNNDPVEIHNRMRTLDWRAAAAVSGYCADLLRTPRAVRTAAGGTSATLGRKMESPPPSPGALDKDGSD